MLSRQEARRLGEVKVKLVLGVKAFPVQDNPLFQFRGEDRFSLAQVFINLLRVYLEDLEAQHGGTLFRVQSKPFGVVVLFSVVY